MTDQASELARARSSSNLAVHKCELFSLSSTRESNELAWPTPTDSVTTRLLLKCHAETVVSIDGQLCSSLIAELQDPDSTTAQLAVAESLRQTHALSGVVREFTIDEYQSIIAFAGPAYSADVFVDMKRGSYELTEVRQGLTALVNDLHKGRDSGPVWSFIIDASAVLTTLISATGLLLILWLRRKRLKGLITATFGTLALVGLYLIAVP